MAKIEDDSPIKKSKHDMFDYKALAKSVAKCIVSIKKTKGGVIAIRGSWGAGKSSVVNMVCRRLKNKGPIVIKFSSWCYRSEDEIVAGFFQELYAGLKSEVEEADLKPVAELAVRIMGIMKIAAKFAVPGADAVISSGQEVLEKAIAQGQTIDSLQKKVSVITKNLNRKILFVIDDIDRLSPDEAIAIFRTIKSVGRLENVIYLLSYDRIATENAIGEVYPSEGNRYLEKIIQAAFDLPTPSQPKLTEMLMSRFHRIFGSKFLDDSPRINEIIKNVVVPEIDTPRNVHRLANIISVTYPSVKNNVDIGDFIAIESFRLFRPNVYKRLQDHKRLLVSSSEPDDKKYQVKKRDIKSIFLSKEPKKNRSRLTYSLSLLFPFLERKYSQRTLQHRLEYMTKHKHVSSEFHFDTYFRFSVSEDTVSSSEFDDFISRVGDSNFVISRLSRDPNKLFNANKVSNLLDEIIYNMDAINHNDIETFLVTLYTIADEISEDLNSNKKSYRAMSNRERIFELSKRVLEARSDKLNTPEIIFSLHHVAPLDMSVSLCGWVCRNFHSNVEVSELNFGQHPLTHNDIQELKKITLDKIQNSIKDASIFKCIDLYDFLTNWHEVANDSDKVKKAFSSVLKKSQKNVILAADGFSNLVPEDLSSGKKYDLTRRISALVDVEFFLSRLYAVKRSKGYSRKFDTNVHRVFDLLS